MFVQQQEFHLGIDVASRPNFFCLALRPQLGTWQRPTRPGGTLGHGGGGGAVGGAGGDADGGARRGGAGGEAGGARLQAT